MKIALAQLNYHIGNFESNTAKIIEHIKIARNNGADLVVFAELCVPGYPSRDFLEFDEFIDLCEESAQKIAAECTDIACIIGLPTPNDEPEGKELHNSAYFIEKGIVKAVVHKSWVATPLEIPRNFYGSPNSKKFDNIKYKVFLQQVSGTSKIMK